MIVEIHYRVEDDFEDLLKVNQKLSLKVLSSISLLQERGLSLLETKFLEFIERDVYALRVDAFQHFVRLYLYRDKYKMIVFYIILKKTNAIPNHELRNIRNRLRSLKEETYEA